MALLASSGRPRSRKLMPKIKLRRQPKSSVSSNESIQDLTSAFADLQLPTFGNASHRAATTAGTDSASGASTVKTPNPFIPDIEVNPNSTAIVPFRLLGLAPEMRDLQLPISSISAVAQRMPVINYTSKLTPIASFRFVDLPLELRELVYHRVFHGTIVDYMWNLKVTKWVTHEEFWLSAVSGTRNLLRTSKCIYTEAINIFWSKASVRLFGNTYWMHHNIERSLSGCCLAHLTKLEIVKDKDKRPYGVGLLKGNLSEVVKLLPRLSEIRLGDEIVKVNTSGDEELDADALLVEIELANLIKDAFLIAAEIPTIRVYGKVAIKCQDHDMTLETVSPSQTSFYQMPLANTKTEDIVGQLQQAVHISFADQAEVMIADERRRDSERGERELPGHYLWPKAKRVTTTVGYGGLRHKPAAGACYR